MSDDDIISHSGLNHEIELAKKAYKRVQQLFNLPAEVRGTSFVVCVGADRIFAGEFWTPVSSISFDGIVIRQPFTPNERIIGIGRISQP